MTLCGYRIGCGGVGWIKYGGRQRMWGEMTRIGEDILEVV